MLRHYRTKIFMKNKSINNYNSNINLTKHPKVKGLKVYDGINNFSISWLNKLGYCEYQLYLEHLKGVTAPDTKSMKKGPWHNITTDQLQNPKWAQKGKGNLTKSEKWDTLSVLYEISFALLQLRLKYYFFFKTKKDRTKHYGQ